MVSTSRTKKSIKNSATALLFYFFQLILKFISQKVFIDTLGTEILGLNSTAQNLLSFLNLAELGIGSAVAFTLYKPLYENDKKRITEIISVLGWLYSIIAVVVIATSMVLMFLFPVIFAKIKIPLWYAYISFAVLLYSTLLSYFVNYRQVILSANQQDYKIKQSYTSVIVIKTLVQILALYYLDNPYVSWCILEVIFASIASYSLNKAIHKECPFLNTSIKKGYKLRKQYPNIIKKTNQLFFHRIGAFALTQTSPLILYGYTTLTMVTMYNNYMLIMSGVNYLLKACFDSMSASVGNLVSEGNKFKILAVFNELFSIRWLFASICAFSIYEFSDTFVSLWVGNQYVLEKSTVALLTLILFIRTARSTVDDYLQAYGLYNDIGAPICEAILNISLSIALGYYWGLNGILLGVLVSLFIVVCVWKPYFLFKKGLKDSVLKYVFVLTKNSACFILSILIISKGKNLIILDSDSVVSFIFIMVITSLAFGGIMFLFQFLIIKETHTFIKRIISMVK